MHYFLLRCNGIIQFILLSSIFKKKNLKEFGLDQAKFSMKTKPTAFYHPDHLNTRCVVESFDS